MLSLRWALPFFFFFCGGGVWDPSLHLLSRSVTQVTPFLGKTRGTQDKRRIWATAPPQRHRNLALGFRTLWVTNERFGMLILTVGLGVLWNEDRGLSFVWSESHQDVSVLQLHHRLCIGSAALGDAQRGVWTSGEARRLCSFIVLFPGLWVCLWYSFSGGKNDSISYVSLRRDRVLEDRLIYVGMN